MSEHDWFVEHRFAFVTRSLEPDEDRTFHQHLQGCAECRAEVARIEVDLRWLPMGVEPMSPRPGFTRRLVEGVLGTPSPRGQRVPVAWWGAMAALAASLVIMALGSWQLRGRAAGLEQRVGTLSTQLASVQDTLSIIRDASRVLQANINMEQHQGAMLIFADERTHRWNVVLHGLPPAPAGTVYQFWFICADGMVRGMQFQQDTVPTSLRMTGMPPRGGAVMGAMLTVEPMTNRTEQPQGKELVHLML